jgi:two-component system, OmpR family, sensor histidine kinase QseC
MSFRLSHLAVLLALTIIVATGGGIAATYRVADKEFRDVLDDDLESQSEFLAELLSAERTLLDPGDLRELLRDTFERDGEDTRWVSVYNLRTERIVSNLSHDLPLEAGGDRTVSLAFDGYRWNGYQTEEDDVVVQILRRDDLFLDVQEEILEEIITPALIGGVVNLLLLGTLIGLFIWPLTRLVRQIESRSAGSLAPVELKSPAREIRVLRDALNRMIDGVDGVLKRERQFASDVAHELRTPLTTLKLELAGPEPDHRAMKEEVDRLARLVEQLLTLARLEQGQWREHFEAVELGALLGRVVARFRDKFTKAGMTLESSLSPATVAGDATLLDILLQNLLNNALIHCPAGTEVDVHLERVDGGEGPLRLRVSDTGPGVAADKREHMSHSFVRLDSKGEGLGLGLAICAKIAEVHGATLRFLSRNDGRAGLVVEIDFPS